MAEHRYLEIEEQLTEEEQLEKQPSIVRVEVKDKAEAEKVYPDYEVDFEGKKYKVKYHIHFHSAKGANRPCEVEILKNAT